MLTLNTQGTYFFETNILSVGAQYKKETLDDRATNIMHADNNGTATTGYNSYDVTKTQYAIFAEDEWNVLDNLALTGGFRVNNYEDYGTHFTPRVYAVYSITDEWIVKGGLSGGYKVPSLRQSADDFGGVSGGGAFPPVVMIGSPDVKPESSINYEVSAAYVNKEVGFGATITAYHTDYKDKIVSYAVCDRDPATALPYCNETSAIYYGNPTADHLDVGGGPYSTGSIYDNEDKAQYEGVEVTVNYDLPSIVSLGATYTYTDSASKTGKLKDKPISGTPKNMYNANVDFKITEWFNLWGQFTYVGKQKSYNLNRLGTDTTSSEIKSYGIVDVGTVFRLKDNLKFLAGVYNVADKEVTNETHGRYIDGRRLIVGFNADF
jgi:outer membrane receptor for ferrienterochelin and colicins